MHLGRIQRGQDHAAKGNQDEHGLKRDAAVFFAAEQKQPQRQKRCLNDEHPATEITALDEDLRQQALFWLRLHMCRLLHEQMDLSLLARLIDLDMIKQTAEQLFFWFHPRSSSLMISLSLASP